MNNKKKKMNYNSETFSNYKKMKGTFSYVKKGIFRKSNFELNLLKKKSTIDYATSIKKKILKFISFILKKKKKNEKKF